MRNSLEETKGDGHRSRLRDRFLQSGLDGFLDYEILELLLTLGTPRKDCKKSAKDLIKKFGCLDRVMEASSNELQQVHGIGPSNIVGIKIYQAISERCKERKINNKSFDSASSIYEYLLEKIGKEKKEHFVLLFLDTKNSLIFSNISIGTLNASIVHPREVFKEAILYHASHVIVAHNHPTGDSAPSKSDFMTTKRLVEAGEIIGITIADHIIVAKNGYYSFKERGII